MADSYIGLPTDGAGKKLDTEQLTVGANTVQRQRDRLAGAAATEIAEVRNSDVSPTDHGLAIRPINVVSPTRDALSSADLAAGSSVNLDGTTIGSSKTGKLMGVTLSSSAPCKWTIQKRDGGVVLDIDVVFTSQLELTKQWTPPDKRFATQAGNGDDENFRVVAENLHAVSAADVYATLYWDEV